MGLLLWRFGFCFVVLFWIGWFLIGCDRIFVGRNRWRNLGFGVIFCVDSLIYCWLLWWLFFFSGWVGGCRRIVWGWWCFWVFCVFGWNIRIVYCIGIVKMWRLWLVVLVLWWWLRIGWWDGCGVVCCYWLVIVLFGVLLFVVWIVLLMWCWGLDWWLVVVWLVVEWLGVGVNWCYWLVYSLWL